MKAVFEDGDVTMSGEVGDLFGKELVTGLLDKTLESGIRATEGVRAYP
jgi:hypothetical protein